MIEKRLEQVVVAFIDHDHISRRACQRLDGGQPAESRADDNNARRIRLDTHGRVIRRFLAVINELCSSLPEQERDDPMVREMMGYGCKTTMHPWSRFEFLFFFHKVTG